MHTPESHAAPSNLRDFLRSYAMIVLSILTALGFERAAVALHDRNAARDSKMRIERELEADAADLRASMDKNKANMDAARTILKTLLAAITAGKADSAATAVIMSDSVRAHLSINEVSWQRDAWDAAIADQSASHLAQADLQSYAQIYAQARDSIEAFHVVVTGQLIGQVPEVQLSAMLNRLDAHDCALLLVRYLAAIQQVNDIEGALADSISGRGKGV
jgi:hypothetical protein